MSETLSHVRALLGKLKKARMDLENAQHDAQTYSDEVMPLLLALDPDKKGVVFELDGAKSAGYRQQNKPSTVVDTAALIAYLKRRGMWEACMTEQLDMKKVEAAVAAGHLKAAAINKYMSEGKEATPYVKFMNPKRDSL